MSDATLTFEALYKTHYNSLRNTATNIISDRDGAHDIVQEVFLKLWHRKEELKTIFNQKAYLFKSVINASLSYLENRKPVITTEHLRIETAGNVGSSIDQKELEARVDKALNSLPPKCKTIFVLSRFEDMKYKEIAEYLEISVNTVENQMGIALKKMRVELSMYLTHEFIALAIGTGCIFLMRFLSLELMILIH